MHLATNHGGFGFAINTTQSTILGTQTQNQDRIFHSHCKVSLNFRFKSKENACIFSTSSLFLHICTTDKLTRVWETQLLVFHFHIV